MMFSLSLQITLAITLIYMCVCVYIFTYLFYLTFAFIDSYGFASTFPISCPKSLFSYLDYNTHVKA